MTTMMTLSELTERRDFLMAQVDVLQTPGKVHVDDIPVSAPVATTKAERRAMECSKDGKWRWPAGGVGMILALNDCNILLTIHRDSGAPSYANHDTLSSGLGSSVREMLYPMETAWREGAEELCIVTPSAVICPIPETDDFGFGIELGEVTQGTANLFPELRGRPVVDVRPRFLALKGEHDLVVSHAGRTRSTRGLVVFDPATNGIDLLKAVVVPVNCALKDVSMYDGELTQEGQPLNRRVNALELDQAFRPTGHMLASWLRGRPVKVEDDQRPMTPLLQDFHQALLEREAARETHARAESIEAA